MRDSRSVIRIDMILLVHGGQHGSMSRIITSKCIGHQPSGLTALTFEQAAEKPFRGTLLAAALHENNNHIPILSHRSSQILVLSLNRDKDFVDIPGVA